MIAAESIPNQADLGAYVCVHVLAGTKSPFLDRMEREWWEVPAQGFVHRGQPRVGCIKRPSSHYPMTCVDECGGIHSNSGRIRDIWGIHQ